MKIHISILLMFCTIVLTSCEKNAVQDISGDPPPAAVKFFNFGVGSPAVNFYANDTKMTAINSASGNESTVGVGYGGVGAGGLYVGIAPGQYTFRGKIAAATDKDLAISNIAGTIAADKRYSVYQSGIYNSTAKTIDGFIIEDNFPAVDTGKAYVRFVNAISNSNAMTLYARNNTTGTETAIGSAVAYKGGSAFVAVPNGVYSLNTRYAGSNTNVITRSGVSFSKGRIYTIGARGNMTVSTGTTAPALDNTANY